MKTLILETLKIQIQFRALTNEFVVLQNTTSIPLPHAHQNYAPINVFVRC